jgi:hypothetical protein
VFCVISHRLQLPLRHYFRQCDSQDFASAEATSDNSSVTNSADINAIGVRYEIIFHGTILRTFVPPVPRHVIRTRILRTTHGDVKKDEHGDATPYSGRQVTDLGCKYCARDPSSSYSGTYGIFCLLRRGYLQPATKAQMLRILFLLHTRGGRSFSCTSIHKRYDDTARIK